MATLELSINTEYVPNWGVWEAVRELLQNALDARVDGHEVDIRHWPETKRLVIRNAPGPGGTPLDMGRERLLLGSTSKAGRADQRGQFGEGFKLALLVLTRTGMPVTVHVPGETWKPSIQPSAAFGGADVLVVKTTRRPGRRQTVEFIVENVSAESWANIKSAVLHLSPPDQVVETSTGNILLDERHANLLFSGGLLVCKLPDNYRFGYDLAVNLDRDRKMADPWDLRFKVASALSEAVVAEKLDLDQVLAASRGEAKALSEFAWTAKSVAEKAAESFAKEHGPKAVPVADMAQTSAVSQHGLTPIMVAPEVLTLLESVEGKLEDRLSSTATETTQCWSPSDLSADERANFWWAMDVVGRVDPIDEAVLVVDFVSDDVCGSTDGRTIRIARKQLADRARLIATLVHELAHASGSDGSAEHRQAIERIFGNIVASHVK